MYKKLAKIKYLPNNFEIVEKGDHVICSVSGKQIPIEKLNYWNVELQEPYFSYIEASKKAINFNNLSPPIMGPYPLIRIFQYHFF